ncbi:hypothetical protein [Snodgrassella alvi]
MNLGSPYQNGYIERFNRTCRISGTGFISF